ncbi:MAG: protein-glutamate O-methyltransferase CheR [Cytophagaceae bacterium]|nr:protein-glutamate O-methyltransferase CheR [Cytophagaceae bacterium]MDW8456203.1 protein-glutamate O-methyltransferase CheR [Cytophagaceae bacterium]
MQDISINDTKRICEVVKDKYGYDFTNYAMSSFKRRINRVMEIKKISTIDNLLAMIKNNQIAKDEFLHEITVNVTELFRDPSFWRALKQVIPNLFLNQQKIRIWHAGCSSGEEAYSMLIVLEEMGLLDKVEIIASDIDKCILEKAKSGRIQIRKMDINEKNYIRYNNNGDIRKYFQYEKEYAVFDLELLKRVSFREINLVNAVPFTKCDLILCRNVMIYFNQQLQKDVIRLFHESLFMYGYLAIGSKESIIWSDVAGKFLVVNQEEKIYKKYKD